LKSVADVAVDKIVPLGGETEIFPVETPFGTVTRMVVLFEMVKSLAATLPKLMPEMPIKLAPVRITFVPVRPEAGTKLVIDDWTKKFVAVVMTLLVVLKIVPDFDWRMSGPVV